MIKTSFTKTMTLLPALVLLAGCVSSYKIEVSNPLSIDRDCEIVEISLQGKSVKKGKIIVTDSNGNQLPYQIASDGKLLFCANVKASSKSVYKIRRGIPEKFDTICCGSFRADRMDDFIWENDKSGYRTYGPALQDKGERAFGYDIFTKSVSRPVMTERFDKALYGNPKISFHIDHGDGMDSYGVGPTLGCGADAIVAGDNLIYPWCWDGYEILESGPIRFKAKFEYSPIIIDGKQVIERRTITLDKGSYLNKVDVEFEGLDKDYPIAAGVVVHPENPEAYRYGQNNNGGYTAYADLGDRNIGKNGEIYVGTVFTSPLMFAGYRPFSKEDIKNRNGALGHVLGIGTYQTGQKYTYFFGSGWSKGDIKDLDNWEHYLKNFSTRVHAPLTINIK